VTSTDKEYLPTDEANHCQSCDLLAPDCVCPRYSFARPTKEEIAAKVNDSEYFGRPYAEILQELVIRIERIENFVERLENFLVKGVNQ